MQTHTEPTRARLLTLLSEACELEHALSCSYLFAAFSLKKEIAEGITWDQQQLTRRWASQVFHVAAQEMLHLAQAWNLLVAVGGSPYVARPPFPRPARWFHLPVSLTLRQYDAATLRRFIIYETPAPEHATTAMLSEVTPWPFEESLVYGSVGELYGECARIIDALGPTAFVTAGTGQAGADLAHFTDLIPVHDVDSARKAIDRITTQGEGMLGSRADSHYEIFRGLLKELHACGFEPSRPVGDNPYVVRRRQDLAMAQDLAALEATLGMTRLSDTVAEPTADLFDDVYGLMLQLLSHAFGFPVGRGAPTFSQIAIELMTTVLRPLGEALCQMPSGSAPGVNAGPPFGLWRTPALTPNTAAAEVVVRERLRGLSAVALRLQVDVQPLMARDQIRAAGLHLERLAQLLPR